MLDVMESAKEADIFQPTQKESRAFHYGRYPDQDVLE